MDNPLTIVSSRKFAVMPDARLCANQIQSSIQNLDKKIEGATVLGPLVDEIRNVDLANE